MVRARRFREEQAHRVALIAERRLHADEDVAEALAVDEELGAVRVEVARGLPPVLLERLGVGAQPLVLVDGHAVGHVHVGRVVPSLGVVEDRLHQRLRGGRRSAVGLRGEGRHVERRVADVVAVPAEVLEDFRDGAEDVEVGGRADVALVRRERKDGDGELLVVLGLGRELGPVDGAGAEGVDAVREGVRLARRRVAPSENNRLQRPIQLRQRHLQRHLHRVHAQLRAEPLLGGLEDQGQGAQVGHVELLEGLDGLGRVLARGAPHQREARQGDDAADKGLARAQRVVEEALDRAREVETAGEHGHDLRATRLELRHHSGVVALVARH